MTALRSAVDALINRAEAGAADPASSAEDMLLYAKTLEAVGPTSAVGFINATSEAQNARVLATGEAQNARVLATGEAQNSRVITTGDDEVLRVKDTMGAAIGVLSTKGDLLWHNGSGAARLPVGSSGQVLQVGAGGQIQWGASKIINTYHHFWSEITRTTWSSAGNLLTGSPFTYTPTRAGSWFWVDHRIYFSTNQNYSGTAIMFNVAGAGWQITTSSPLKRGADNWTSFSDNYYRSGSGNGYFYSDGNGAYKMVGSVLIAPTYSAGQTIQFGATAWSQNSNWWSVNEQYNQNNNAARYGWSEIHVFELQPSA